MKKNDKIKELRKKLGMTQAVLAKKIGVAQTYVAAWESGRRNPIGDNLIKLADILDVDVKYLAYDEDSNAKPAKFKGNGEPNMWIVPIKAQGGFLAGYGDQVYMGNELEKVYFPFIAQECFAFEIDGLSMITDYMPGEYFVGTLMESLDHLVKGRVYVFQTIDGIILKEFVKVNDELIYLRSQNEDYNPVKPIHLKNVKRCYQREMVIKN